MPSTASRDFRSCFSLHVLMFYYFCVFFSSSVYPRLISCSFVVLISTSPSRSKIGIWNLGLLGLGPGLEENTKCSECLCKYFITLACRERIKLQLMQLLQLQIWWETVRPSPGFLWFSDTKCVNYRNCHV